MAEQIGIITEDQGDGWAIVVSDRKGACSGCHAGDGCHSCLSWLSSTKMESRVANPIHARKGDVVKVRTRSSDLYKGAFILYVVPIIGLMAGALSGAALSTRYGWPQSIVAVITGIAGLALGVAAVVVMDRSRYVRQHMTPSIVEVVIPAADFQAPAGQLSCCS